MKMTYPAEIKNLHEILGKIEEFAIGAGCAPERLVQLTLIAEELVVNVMSYAYEGDKGPLEIELKETDGFIIICFGDTGTPFNPLETGAPDTSSELQEREAGGLGIHMVRQFAEDIFYERTKNRNILTVTYKKS